MLGTGRFSGRLGAGSVGALLVLALAHPAVADSTVTVRGTDLPVGTGLAHVGCAAPYAAAGPLQPYVGQVPGAPLGERSLGVSPGAGSAAGPVAYTGSVADVAAASVSAHAPGGTTGVAWVGYQAPADAGTSRVWFGRAPLSVPGGGWSSVSAVGRTLDWTQYDAATGAVLADGPAQTVADLVAERGDGPGLYALGLGCDGSTVDLDGFRFGAAGDVTTYDLEGLATSMAMLGGPGAPGGRTELVAGETVTLRGSLSISGDTDVPRATAILERRTSDGGPWQTVRVVDADQGATALVTTAIIEPAASGTYRWRFVDRPLAEGSTSGLHVVDVAAAVTARAADDAVTGRVSPGGADRLVELRPASASASGDPLATARTAADGSFTIPLEGVEKGRYVVTTPAALGNTRGTSAVVVAGSAPESKPTARPTPTPTTPTQKPSTAPTEGPEPTATRTPEPTPSARPTQPSSTQPSPTRTPEPTPSAVASTPTSVPPSDEPSSGGTPSATVTP